MAEAGTGMIWIFEYPSLALQACCKRLPRHRLHSRGRLIQRCSISSRRGFRRLAPDDSVALPWRSIGVARLEIDSISQRLGQAGHFLPCLWIVMDIAVALPIPDGFHERCDGVAQMQGDGLAGGR